jgi:phosphoserine phosphatase RsbU/P
MPRSTPQARGRSRLGGREHATVEGHLIAMADETTVQCGPADRPFVCTELYAGNERAHRLVRLPGLEADVSALPSDGREGGDLYALFSCGADRFARVVLADAVGHGFTASGVAAHIHGLLHKHRDVEDVAGLLAALNRTFHSRETPESPLRLATVVTANYDRTSGEFNFAYAAHPRMLVWRARGADWYTLGEGLDGLPLGVIAGELYSQGSVRLEPGDMVMAFSDAVTEVKSPQGDELTAEGFRGLAQRVAAGLAPETPLAEVSKALLGALRRYQEAERFEDDLTLLLLRRSAE